ncbi:MAG: NRDE family protein [Peptococcaceae bacterium]|nr:NRDE family protein [Peptococcaceae bacterium]
MCLILFANDCHPRYYLVVAANRDEYYNRPTLPAAFWPESPNLLAGKDLQMGGTWMGITTTGRFAALTNYREKGTQTRTLSRGLLVREYLCSSDSPVSYINTLKDGGAEFNGFNLLLGDTQGLYYYSNREKILHRVEKGYHGLSNSLLDVPWPKVSKGIKAFAACLAAGESINKERLFAILADKERPPDHELPQTGVSLEWERTLSPAFIVSPDYGTRCSTILLIDRCGQVRFWERSYLPGKPEQFNEVVYEFDISQN